MKKFCLLCSIIVLLCVTAVAQQIIGYKRVTVTNGTCRDTTGNLVTCNYQIDVPIYQTTPVQQAPSQQPVYQPQQPRYWSQQQTIEHYSVRSVQVEVNFNPNSYFGGFGRRSYFPHVRQTWNFGGATRTVTQRYESNHQPNTGYWYNGQYHSPPGFWHYRRW